MGLAHFHAQNPAQNVAQVFSDRNAGILGSNTAWAGPDSISTILWPSLAPSGSFDISKTSKNDLGKVLGLILGREKCQLNCTPVSYTRIASKPKDATPVGLDRSTALEAIRVRHNIHPFM